MDEALEAIKSLQEIVTDSKGVTALKHAILHLEKESGYIISMQEELEAANNRIKALERSERHLEDIEAKYYVIKDLATPYSSLAHLNDCIKLLEKLDTSKGDSIIEEDVPTLIKILQDTKEYLLDLDFTRAQTRLQEGLYFVYTSTETPEDLYDMLDPIITKLAWNVGLRDLIWEDNATIF